MQALYRETFLTETGQKANNCSEFNYLLSIKEFHFPIVVGGGKHKTSTRHLAVFK